MARPDYEEWTPEEIDFVINNWPKNGATIEDVREIAAALKLYSVMSVAQRARYLGLKFLKNSKGHRISRRTLGEDVRRYKKYTEEEIQMIVSLRKKKCNNKEIAAKLDRTHAGIRNVVVKLIAKGML